MIIESLAPLAVEIDSLVLLPGNPRKGDVEAVAASLGRFGQRKPIVVRASDRVVIAGNHTWQAAKSLGWDEIAAVLVDDDTATSEAFALADNRTAELGGYDEAALLELIRSVGEVDASLLLDTGWDADSVQALVDRVDPGLPDLPPSDDAPEPPVEPFTKPGDVWVLGGHRVVCGDSSDPLMLDAALGGDKPDMVFTDPPYGVDYVSRVDEGRRKPWGGIKNDDLQGSSLRDFLIDIVGTLPEPRYVCCNWQSCVDFMVALGKPNALIVWDKGSIGLGKGYRNQHEFILFYGKLDHNSESNVWTIKRDSVSGYEHPTQKPVAVPQRAIENSSKRGGVVLDVFGGSGSTLMACEYTGRKGRLIELDPKYVDVICRRWQEHTGALPVLESTGQTHNFTEGIDG